MDKKTLDLYDDTGKDKVGQPQDKSKESEAKASGFTLSEPGDPPNTADLPPTALDYLDAKRNIIVGILTMPGCHAMSAVAMMKLVYDAAYVQGEKDGQRS